jgi:2-dehydropantoate 2-reductase
MIAARDDEERPGPRAVVVGAGAVGSFLGGTLAAAGWDVTLVGRRDRGGRGGDRASSPLVIDGPEGQRTVSVRRTADPASIDGAPDVVVLAVKAFDVEDALETAARWPSAPLVTAQNGVGSEATAAALRASPLIAASLTTAVEPVHGGVKRRRRGGIGLAVVRGDVEPLVRDLAAAFEAGGLPSMVCPDAAAMKWSKLLANLVGNATAALLDMDPGAIYADRDGFALERAQLLEALAVMRARGLRRVTMPGAQVNLLLAGLRLPAWLARPVLARAIGRARGGKSPSLRLHVRGAASGPTEVRWLNGAVAVAGAQSGIPVPVNACLAALVDEAAADPATAERWSGRPDLLRHAADAWPGGR